MNALLISVSDLKMAFMWQEALKLFVIKGGADIVCNRWEFQVRESRHEIMVRSWKLVFTENMIGLAGAEHLNRIFE